MKIFLSDVTPTKIGPRGRICPYFVKSTSADRSVAYMLGAKNKNWKHSLKSNEYLGERKERIPLQFYNFFPQTTHPGAPVDLTQPTNNNSKSVPKFHQIRDFWGSEKSRLFKKGRS